MHQRFMAHILAACCALASTSSLLAADAGGIFLNKTDDGTVELSNTFSQQDSVLLVAPAAPAPTVPLPSARAVPAAAPKAAVAADHATPQPAADSSSAVAADKLQASTGFAQISPNEKYRDQMLQPQAPRGSMQNQAVSRRYTMQNRPQLPAM